MATCFSALLILSFFFCSLADAKAVENLDISINTTDGSYQILLSNKLWFNSGPVAIRYKGECLASENSSLSLLNHSVFSGEDAWGQFTSTELWWQSADKTFNYVTYINQYNDLPILGFVQRFDDGTSDASPGSTDGIISSFPTLLVEDLGLERAFMTYSGGFASDVHVHEWSSDETIPGGYDGGVPLVVFDSALENTVVISPANTFMSASQASWSPKSSKSPAVGFGITGSVSYVPKLYVYKTVLVAGQNVTGTMLKWGHLLRKLYGKEDDTYRKSDFSINYLGYWTDNGACYYYNTANYSNYEDALVAVKKRADEQGIPFRYLQIDSWWYFKGTGNGVKNWTAMPSVFPNGIDAVVQKTGWPVMAHNRYWSANTDYAKHNGGEFNFIIDGNLALPNDSSFWYYLLSSSKLQWDLFVYEQDWLLTVARGFHPVQQDLFLGRDWLMQMGTAAEELGMTIQYCMPWTRHLLQSVEIPAVTQTRASGDYQPQNMQWMIGDTTILAHALGLAAFKDNFHTTPQEEGCKFTKSEAYPELETYMAALSAGPVGPSDAADGANKMLIMATCMSDGRLLKPSHPVMSVDSSFVYRAFKKDGPSGQLYAGYTEVRFNIHMDSKSLFIASNINLDS